MGSKMCNTYCRDPELMNSKVCCFSCERFKTCGSTCDDKECKNYDENILNGKEE